MLVYRINFYLFSFPIEPHSLPFTLHKDEQVQMACFLTLALLPNLLPLHVMHVYVHLYVEV